MCSGILSDLCIITVFTYQGLPDKITVHLSFQHSGLCSLSNHSAEQNSSIAILPMSTSFLKVYVWQILHLIQMGLQFIYA